MASIESAFGGNLEGGFEPDDFYESFLAPKFHDFTAPEEPIDPDAYFLSKPGMLKKAFAVEEVKTVAPKVHKVATMDTPKTAPESQQQVPLRSPVAAEKTVRSGSAKRIPVQPTSLASPLATSKSLRNGSNNGSNSSATINSPANQLPMLEKPGNNGSLKPTSLANKLQASENDDPNSPSNNISPAKAAMNKPALTRQRSQKAQEVKPALTRQRSQKLLGDASDSNSSEKESDFGKRTDKGTPQKESLKSGVVATTSTGVLVGAVKALKLNAVDPVTPTCKTPVKEVAPEAKKATSCTESPYGGHHCKNSRCAANDPNFASPVPTKKFLIAKKGTPGSILKATPNHEKCNEDASSENSEQSSDAPVEVNANGNDCGVVVPKSKVALEDAFNKMTLEQQQTSKQVLTQVEDLKEVLLLEEEKSLVVVQPLQSSLSAEEIRAWSRNSVNCEEKAASSSDERTTTANVEEAGTHRDSKPTGVDLFLQVASDCLENMDSIKLNVPPTKVSGKKRKSGEVLPAGASKKANCGASGEKNKVIYKKVPQGSDTAASKTAKMRLRRLSVAPRLSVARSRPGVTNPRPFRLRTQERGAVKEREFIRKVQEYKAAKEGFNSAFQGLAAVEPKITGKFLKPGHVFSAERAGHKDDKEVTKPTVPVAQKAPHFDHPFKPHRSTKKLTVPQEPKFHTGRGSRICPSHVAVPA